VKGTKNGWTLFLLVLFGVVFGGFLGSLTEEISALKWLNYGQALGLENPIVLNVGILVLTFGLNLRITVASILGIMLALIIYRWI